MAEEIITSKDLHLYYGKKEALKGIDLSKIGRAHV